MTTDNFRYFFVPFFVGDGFVHFEPLIKHDEIQTRVAGKALLVHCTDAVTVCASSSFILYLTSPSLYWYVLVLEEMEDTATRPGAVALSALLPSIPWLMTLLLLHENQKRSLQMDEARRQIEARDFAE